MADGGLNIELEPELAERLRAAAASAGESVQDYARHALAAAIDEDWAEDHARIAAFEATGRSISREDFIKELRAAADTRFRRG